MNSQEKLEDAAAKRQLFQNLVMEHSTWAQVLCAELVSGAYTKRNLQVYDEGLQKWRSCTDEEKRDAQLVSINSHAQDVSRYSDEFKKYLPENL